jgi:hypothetical protein
MGEEGYSLPFAKLTLQFNISSEIFSRMEVGMRQAVSKKHIRPYLQERFPNLHS